MMKYLKVLKAHKKRVIVIMLAIIAIIAGTGLYKKRDMIYTPRVRIVTDAVYAMGLVKTDRYYSIKTGTSSIVTKRYVNEGDVVHKGDLLLATDLPVVLRSAIDGVVTTVNVNEHELTTAGTELIVVSNLQTLYVTLSLDQESILSVRKGQRAEISFENLRNAKVSGTVESTYPSNTEFVVRVNIDKMPEGVLPGMTCDVAVETARREGVVFIPKTAINGGKVRVIRNGHEEQVTVKSGVIENGWVEITENSIRSTDKIKGPVMPKERQTPVKNMEPRF